MSKIAKHIVVFGGSGFIGSYVVEDLVKNNHIVKIFTRNANKALSLKLFGHLGNVEIIEYNTLSIEVVERYVIKCDIIINLIGILYESRRAKFNDVHVVVAGIIAKIANKYCAKLIHFSAMGVEDAKDSIYAQSKYKGEETVITACSDTIIIRPNLVFGFGDRFFNNIARLSLLLPFLPLIKGGEMLLQPVYVGDIAKLVSYLVCNNTNKTLYNVCGPKVYSIKSLMEFILQVTCRKNILIKLPLFIAKIIAFICEFKIVSIILKPITGNTTPLLTRDQLLFMQYNIVSDDKDLESVSIYPHYMEDIVQQYLKVYKKL
ncbi:complex I NDUFA9 subunit family protein [Neoehrlichia mikurensis]|uniref:Complex I NDUFA9 subunit family protein n=1 Tax=Neoehrlichia mikurensis TaxID=89586 RepID=A0A9Q9F4K9_9RICK|nr:complex I NDUFA9 subunit family protein [Neoehrlichia mikurensis]QXK92294.1 complex I NDUFA9 subunit family protein [Neoehrlichia mikurensis]QXK92748.1 complex I NDUFA9 subunit family protein [Neoehrlichia mikurensis]QXK93989.1 complex I NDUFA9 subunit family protein [Neoehrlichia mikurensis]UTO55848.1 complex I NDUFA9 subunit family protein [Neoehrlichia mikurensis]UTO56763.1 complex I NDUFA9 subunit family protein [Neoehrlichia mikurensis]